MNNLINLIKYISNLYNNEIKISITKTTIFN